VAFPLLALALIHSTFANIVLRSCMAVLLTRCGIPIKESVCIDFQVKLLIPCGLFSLSPAPVVVDS